MKKFKYIIYVVAILLSANCFAQQFSPYVGTWHYQNANQLFIVSIWKESDDRYGHYKMVEYSNGIIGNTVYNSNRDYGNGNRLNFTIAANESAEFGLSGFICDNTIDGYIDTKGGTFLMKILPQAPGCSPCTITASWKVGEPLRDLIVEQEPPFSVPTDIVLTKVSNTVDLD